MMKATLDNIPGRELKTFPQKPGAAILPYAFYDLHVSPVNRKKATSIKDIAFDGSQAANEKKGVDISAWIGRAKGNFGSVGEVDRYIARERESWD